METEGFTTQTAPPTALPPEVQLIQIAFGALVSQALYSAAKFGIADLLADKPQSVEILATATNTDHGALYRVLRALASVGVFEETDPKVFALTPIAQGLRSNVPNSIRNGVVFMGEEWHWRVWGNMTHSLETGKAAWQKVHGREVFDYFQDNQDHLEIFNRAMTEMTASSAPAVVEAYDFSKFDTLVDIAGGHGLLLSQILNANPQLNGVLFDVPPVIAGAQTLLKKQGVHDRVKTVEGNFFKSVPSGGDAYIMKHIIHDWDDARAIEILKNIQAVMNPNGKVLLVEIVVKGGNDPDLSKVMDLEMLVSPGGVERTEQEYRELLDKAGLRLTKIVPTKSAYSIVESVKK